MVAAGQLAMYYNMPLISESAASKDFDDVRFYGTLMRSGFLMVNEYNNKREHELNIAMENF